MLRFKTLFGQLLFTYMLIITASILVLGILIGQIMRWYSVSTETARLNSLAESVSSSLVENFREGNTGTELNQDLAELAQLEHYNINITDCYELVIADVAGIEGADTEMLEEQREQGMATVLAGEEVAQVTYLQDDRFTAWITVGQPIEIDGYVLGAVFVQGQLSNMGASMSAMYAQLGMYACICVVLAFILVYYTARKIEQPLNQMNQAAREIAKGNFDKRLDIKRQDEIGQLAGTFNTMMDTIQKYENTRQSFVANVSHELKSPLTSIQGFVQGILDGTIAKEDEKQYLEIVLSETKRLNVLIVDLLDLAKVESGQFPLHLTEWDLNELIRQCIIKFITKIDDKNIEVLADLPDTRDMVYADQDRMTQVLTNLIDNAVKFTEPGGTLKIWTESEEKTITVSISNTGAIIPEEDIDFVFDRFFKVDKSHNRKAPGTGIGLSIVKNIIQQHDQKVWVNSKEGMGTVFSFTIAKAGKHEKRMKNVKNS